MCSKQQKAFSVSVVMCLDSRFISSASNLNLSRPHWKEHPTVPPERFNNLQQCTQKFSM